MNKLELNHDISFDNDLNFLSQFSSGFEYCDYEQQQIDLSINLLAEEKPKINSSVKIKQLLAKWKKGFSNYNCPLVEKSQLLLKKVSTETAWVSSLLALTSIGIFSEIAPIWSQINQNLALKLPFFPTAIGLKSSTGRLFPLLAMEEIDLIIGLNQFDNWQSKKPNRIDRKEYDFRLSPPKNSQANPKKWLMYETKVNGSLMAIPPLYNEPSVAGFTSFLSTLEFINFSQDFKVNQFNLLNKNTLPDEPSDSVTYNLENKLMATPKVVYKPYLPQPNFLKRN